MVPKKNPVHRGKNPVPPWKNLVFLHTFLCRNTHPPGSARPSPHPCPALQARSGRSLSCTCDRIFASVLFFPGTCEIFPHVREQWRGKKFCFGKRRKLTSWIEATLPTALRLTERYAHATCWAAAFCMYTMVHKSQQLSQIWMLTLTVTASCGSFGFFRITSSGCRAFECSSVSMTKRWCYWVPRWVQWLESGSMIAAQIECKCVNANIAITRRWLSKCCANEVECNKSRIYFRRRW